MEEEKSQHFILFPSSLLNDGNVSLLVQNKKKIKYKKNPKFMYEYNSSLIGLDVCVVYIAERRKKNYNKCN